MLCSQCGTDNLEIAQFCLSCGSRLKAGGFPDRPAAAVIHAGFWRRFAAILIDTVILVLAVLIISIILGSIIGFAGALGGFGRGTVVRFGSITGNVTGIVINWLYFTIMESSSRQSTLGKMVMGIIVTDEQGNRISFGRANGRYWGKIISTATLAIGYIMAGFTRQKQALHDIMAGTLVVKK